VIAKLFLSVVFYKLINRILKISVKRVDALKRINRFFKAQVFAAYCCSNHVC